MASSRPTDVRGAARTGRAKHRLATVFVAALVGTGGVVAGAGAGASSHGAAGTAAGRGTRPAQIGRGGELLALGDSLAAGYEPIYGHQLPPVDPATGLPDRGYPRGYAADLAAREHLRLLDLACPGETTASFSATPAQATCQSLYRRAFGASSQLGAALSALAHHKGAFAVVTIDLGANDVDHCLSASGLSLTCVEQGTTLVGRRLPPILARLRAALRVYDPKARVVGMNYYDPFLGLAYDPGGPKGLAAATVSVAGLGAFNAVLRTAYRGAGMPVADVAAAFSTGSVLPLTTFRGRRLTRDAARVCQLTYMCPAPGSSVPQDIHPNAAGYASIAAAFAAVLRH